MDRIGRHPGDRNHDAGPSKRHAKVIPIKAFRTATPERPPGAGRTKNRVTLVLGSAFGFLTIALFTFASSNFFQPGAWGWYAVLILLFAASALSFFSVRKLKPGKNSLPFCIRCRKRVDSRSGLCPDCRDKAGGPE